MDGSVDPAVQQSDCRICSGVVNPSSLSLVKAGKHLIVQISWTVQRGPDALIAVLNDAVWAFAVRQTSQYGDVLLADKATCMQKVEDWIQDDLVLIIKKDKNTYLIDGIAGGAVVC